MVRGTNIKRNPLAGRNFEYFSEDPYLAGKMATAEVNGVQSNGTGVSVKHFALNNSENFRFMGDSVCDMRAIREIFLKPFEIIVKESKPQTVMCAYNKINGTYCCQNKWLLTDVLRKEWGFDGLVMTDWGATHDRQAMHVRALYFNLLDKEGTEYTKKRLIKALENYGWRLGTGFLSTPLILDVLTEINPEYAYKLLENEQMPGWLFMPKMGATTIWESWEGTQAQGGIASLDHYSKGAVCEWIMNTMCGIKVGDKPNAFVIKPIAGGVINYAKASYDSIYGLVESGWERKDGKVVYTVTIPSNCTAQIILPDGTDKLVAAGTYQF